MTSAMNRLLAALAPLLASSFVLAGCGKSNSGPTAPSTCNGSIADLTAKVNLAIPVGAVIPAGIDTAAVVFSIHVDSLTTPVAAGASALLADRVSLLRLTSGGSITLQTTAITQAMYDDSVCVAQLGDQFHVYSTLTSTAGRLLARLPFDGTTFHRFIGAGREFPAFTDSVLSVARMGILSPAANFAQDDTTTLTITWTPTTSDTSVKVLCELRDSTDTSARSDVVTDAAGTVRIPGSRVAALGSRTKVFLTVARYRARRITAGSSSKPMTLLSEATDRRPITLTAHSAQTALAQGTWRARLTAGRAEHGTPAERFMRLPAYLRRD